MAKILSLKGGGIRGVIQAYALEKIEVELGKPIHEIFDFMGGTSTGGILALLLSTGRYSAKEAGELYSRHGAKIFNRSAYRWVSSMGGLRDEKYDNTPLLLLLKKYFGSTIMSDAIIPVMVTTSDIVYRVPVFIKSWKEANKGWDMWYTAQCISAAPTYFEAAPPGYIDGGVFANNPAREIYAEALKLFHPSENSRPNIIVSMGNGRHTRPISYEKSKDYGALQWLPKIISIMMNEANIASDENTKVFADALGDIAFCFDGDLNIANDDMDDASPRNLLALKEEAKLIYDSSYINDMLRYLDE